MARPEPITVAKEDSICQLARPRSLPTPGNQMELSELGERWGRKMWFLKDCFRYYYQKVREWMLDRKNNKHP